MIRHSGSELHFDLLAAIRRSFREDPLRYLCTTTDSYRILPVLCERFGLSYYVQHLPRMFSGLHAQVLELLLLNVNLVNAAGLNFNRSLIPFGVTL